MQTSRGAPEFTKKLLYAEDDWRNAPPLTLEPASPIYYEGWREDADRGDRNTEGRQIDIHAHIGSQCKKRGWTPPTREGMIAIQESSSTQDHFDLRAPPVRDKGRKWTPTPSPTGEGDVQPPPSSLIPTVQPLSLASLFPWTDAEGRERSTDPGADNPRTPLFRRILRICCFCDAIKKANLGNLWGVMIHSILLASMINDIEYYN